MCDSKKKIISELKNLGCFKTGSFTLKSGKLSNYYIDFRCLISYPSLLSQISNMLNELIKSKLTNKTVICGLPYAGIPYASCISINNNIPMILLRKEQKKHGTKKMIEGVYDKTNDIILIDDIITSGTSIIESLPEFPCNEIKHVVVILDRGEGGTEKLLEMGISVTSLFKLTDFI